MALPSTRDIDMLPLLNSLIANWLHRRLAACQVPTMAPGITCRKKCLVQEHIPDLHQQAYWYQANRLTPTFDGHDGGTRNPALKRRCCCREPSLILCHFLQDFPSSKFVCNCTGLLVKRGHKKKKKSVNTTFTTSTKPRAVPLMVIVSHFSALTPGTKYVMLRTIACKPILIWLLHFTSPSGTRTGVLRPWATFAAQRWIYTQLRMMTRTATLSSPRTSVLKVRQQAQRWQALPQRLASDEEMT